MHRTHWKSIIPRERLFSKKKKKKKSQNTDTNKYQLYPNKYLVLREVVLKAKQSGLDKTSALVVGLW